MTVQAPARQAELYNALYGGKDHRAPDSELADQLTRIFPGLPQTARANQDFLRRAVKALAEAGFWQFLDLGAGYPHKPCLDDVATGVAPGTRMVYVDWNPTVCAHRRALCRADGVRVVEQDIRDLDAVMAEPALREMISPKVPTVVILGAVLPLLSDREATDLIGELRERTAPGSLLVFSTGTRDGLPPAKVAEAVQLYSEHVSPVVMRSRAEILQLLDGRPLLPPGLVKTYAWCADPDDITLADDNAGTPHLYAGVASLIPAPRQSALPRTAGSRTGLY